MQIKDFVKTANVPLAVVELPYEFEFKSQSEEKPKPRKLATVLRLVLCDKRIDELCHEENPEIDLKKFCREFGENIHNLLFNARKTHFALWDGGDVGIDGSIADYDSIHDLNENDLADTIDSCFSTIIRLCKKLGKNEEEYMQSFLNYVTKKDFKEKDLELLFSKSVSFLIQKLLNKQPSSIDVLSPKFSDPKLYYSAYVIKSGD